MKMKDSDDPRIYFAAERTLLAWIRTGLTTIGLGFVVARFGLFLQMMHSAPAVSSMASTIIGVTLALLGACAITVAAWQHLRFCRTLDRHCRPRDYATGWSVWFAVILAAAGIILAVHMLMRSSAG
jgi:putative membrane protein